jgi:hypothetical protein
MRHATLRSGWQPLLWLALWLVGCLGAKDNALFTTSESGGAGSSSPVGASGHGSTSANSGTGTGNCDNRASSGGTADNSTPKGGGASDTTSTPGTASGGASAGAAANGALGGSAGTPELPPTVSSCDELAGAERDPSNGHCYRFDETKRDFASASAACRAAGGHLVSIDDEVENDFVLQVHDDDHWLGASDRRDDRAAGVGDYAWVTDEPWSYEHWEDGQPNAHAVDCRGESGGAHCYEHCAYQNGDGDWLDRACWNEVGAVCEWDLALDPPDARASSQGGAP